MDLLLDGITEFTVIFAVINALLYIKSFALKSKAFKFFAVYLCLVGSIQLTASILGGVFHQHNLFLSHFYFIFQFIFLSLFYFELLGFRWMNWVLIFVLGLIGFQYFQTPEIFFTYNPIGMSITHSVLVLYSLLYFYKQLNGKGDFLIVNVGVFFYLLSSALIFASGNLVFNLNISKSMINLLSNVNSVLYLVFQILIFLEWYKNYRKAA